MENKLTLRIGEIQNSQASMQHTLDKSFGEIYISQEDLRKDMKKSIAALQDSQTTMEGAISHAIDNVDNAQDTLIQTLTTSVDDIKKSQKGLEDVLTKFMNCFSATVCIPAELEKEFSTIKAKIEAIQAVVREDRDNNVAFAAGSVDPLTESSRTRFAKLEGQLKVIDGDWIMVRRYSRVPSPLSSVIMSPWVSGYARFCG